MTAITFSFDEFAQHNPCAGCPAPCCLIQLVQYKTPTTYAEIDHMRYMLQFPRTELISTLEGQWFVLKWETCHHFESSTCTCRVHNTPAKPLVCTSYNAYDCWYKKNFTTAQPPSLYRLNLARFDVWVQAVRFDEDGQIVGAPAFAESQAALQGLPIEPVLQLHPSETLAADVRIQAEHRRIVVEP